MGALDSARGALGGHPYGAGAISAGAIPRPGGGPLPPAVPVEFRTSSLASLATFAVHQTGTAGRWALDTIGSTGSGSTGPGTNSAGPYCFIESSSSSTNSIRINSLLTLNVVGMWPRDIGRSLRLQMCAQGHFDEAGTGWEVFSGHGGTWVSRAFIRGWAYANDRVEGDTITDYGGATHVCVRDGGWIDYDVDIPDGDDAVKIELIYEGGTAHQHDLALWQAQLRND